MGEPRPFESDPLLYGTIEELQETIDLDETKQRPELADASKGYYVAYKVMMGRNEVEKCGQVVDVVLSRRMLIGNPPCPILRIFPHSIYPISHTAITITVVALFYPSLIPSFLLSIALSYLYYPISFCGRARQ